MSAKQIHPTNQPQNSSATDPQGGFKTTALLGLAVGLLPCPSALAAYFAGLSSGSPLTAYGIILLFAAGMAFSLTIAGILLQHFGDRLGSRLQQSSKLPWAHLRAVLILGIGAFNLARLGMA